MSSSIINKLNEIKAQKDNFITPENLKPGINVFNVVSNMTNYGDLEITPNIIGGSYSNGYVNSINISSVTSSIDSNITPENIVNGVNILGVIGNYEGSGGGGVNIPADTKFAYSEFWDAPFFDTSSYYNMSHMFTDCHTLLNVPNYNTSGVMDMSYMFAQCYVLNNSYNLNFDTSNVTNMMYMFQYCPQLTDTHEYNTSKVTCMYAMFESCNSLSNEAIQNIVNMCLNAVNIPSEDRVLANVGEWKSPLSDTIFDNSYYQNRWTELDSAGWSY